LTFYFEGVKQMSDETKKKEEIKKKDDDCDCDPKNKTHRTVEDYVKSKTK
jgi:hypothetical protein